MSVSKADWKQWHDQHWDNLNRLTVAASQSFEETIAAVTSGDAARFLSLTSGDTADGVHQATNTASHAAVGAAQELRDLNLKGNQRRFANQEAIDASDAAISAINQLSTVLDHVDTELVRGVQPDRNAVENDASAIGGIADNLNGRLNSTLWSVQAALSNADAKVQGLMAINKIGRF